MEYLSREDVLNRLGEINNTQLRVSIWRLLTELARRRRQQEADSTTDTQYIHEYQQENSPDYAPKTGPFRARRAD
jgi:hypothetical protein